MGAGWLRSRTGDRNRPSVRLSSESPGLVTLTCAGNESKSATIQVPVTISETGTDTGTPPVIAFEPAFLASALECTGRLNR